MQVQGKIRQQSTILAGAHLEVAYRLVPGLEILLEIAFRGGAKKDKATVCLIR
jgi:hypothetical protein